MSIQGQEPPYWLEPTATFPFPEMDPEGQGREGRYRLCRTPQGCPVFYHRRATG